MPRGDDPFDENGILKDKRSFRVPLTMRDAALSAPAAQYPRVTGARHQPGHVVLANAQQREEARQRREAAYADYNRYISDGWKGTDHQESTDAFANFDPPHAGHTGNALRDAYADEDWYTANAWRGDNPEKWPIGWSPKR